MLTENNWRIRLDAARAHEVRQICLVENRSLSNCLGKLVSEALSARRGADSKIKELVAALTAAKPAQ